MKESKLQYFHSKAFRSVLFSYVGVLLLSMGLLSMVVIWHFVENMKAEEIRVSRNKLYTIVEDMENQMDTMRDITLETAMREEFRLNNFQYDKYEEMEMLKLFKKYKNSSDISEYYFLKYTTVDTIFTSFGSTMPLQVYLEDEFGEEDQEVLTTLLEQYAAEAKDKVYFYKGKNNMLFIYPLKGYASSKAGREAVLCFQSSEEELEKRIQRLTGNAEGKYIMYYRDYCILGNESVLPKEADRGEDVLEMTSLSGNFKIYFLPDEENYFTWQNVFSTGDILMYVGIAMVLFVVVLFLANWNFKPMRRFAEKYQSEAEGDLMADWDSIDALFESMLRGKERNSKLIQEQYQVLREQTLRLLASGGYSDKVLEYMTLLNIKMEASVYGIINCSFSDMQNLRVHYETLYKDVEDLSGDDSYLYSYWRNQSELNVLAALDEEYQLEEVMELLQSLFETKNLSAAIAVTAVSRDLRQLNQNSVKAAGGLQAQEAKEAAAAAHEGETLSEDMAKESAVGEKAAGMRTSTAKQAAEYIRTHCTDYDLSLDLIAQEFQITSTYLCRLIKQETGMSYKEYLTELRINEAKKMLMDKNVSVIDVCQRTGYVNVSHFIKVFQKYTGMTPAKYRDEL